MAIIEWKRMNGNESMENNEWKLLNGNDWMEVFKIMYKYIK
jgi:hypothetical protein